MAIWYMKKYISAALPFPVMFSVIEDILNVQLQENSANFINKLSGSVDDGA